MRVSNANIYRYLHSDASDGIWLIFYVIRHSGHQDVRSHIATYSAFQEAQSLLCPLLSVWAPNGYDIDIALRVMPPHRMLLNDYVCTSDRLLKLYSTGSILCVVSWPR